MEKVLWEVVINEGRSLKRGSTVPAGCCCFLFGASCCCAGGGGGGERWGHCKQILQVCATFHTYVHQLKSPIKEMFSRWHTVLTCPFKV